MKKLMFIVLSFVFAVVGMNAQKPNDGAKGAEKMKNRLEQLKTELKLTDDQSKKIEDLFISQGKIMKELRESGDVNREKMKDLMKERETKMKEILTPEQQAKFLEMNKKNRKDHAPREREDAENK
jgi:Spy/CpxP family protein refolding chaperone